MGLLLYLWIVVDLFKLGRNRNRPSSPTDSSFLDREFRALWPLLLGVYLLNGSFVVMNYQFVNGFLFTVAGLLVAQNRRNAGVEPSCKLMPTVAYLTNQFPSPVEPYVADEIQELRSRGVTVIPCSARHATKALDSDLKVFAAETLYLQPLRLKLLIHAAFLCFLKFSMLKDFFRRALFQGSEPLRRRLRALLHTWLGVYYALLIEGSGVEHIHVHHGYFASWIAMVAARVLGIEFSMTLHGSDLLLHPAYLDTKLKHCKFCVTISEFNRRHILERYPDDPTGQSHGAAHGG